MTPVPMPEPLLISSAADLDAAAIGAVARGRSVAIGASLLTDLATQRVRVLRTLSDGGPVYGVSTGMGAQSEIRLTTDGQRDHQHNLLLARAVGGPPWLPPAGVRALFAVRLRTFLSGDAGVSPELVLQLVRFLDAGLTPAVPRAGYGSAGEIIALAHAFGPLTGTGSVLAGSSIVDAARALTDAGLTPIGLGPKEGIALLQGVPGTTAQAVLLAADVARLIEQAVTVLAIALTAAAASRDPFLPELARGDAELAAVCARLGERLAGTVQAPRSLQAPVSFRVGGVVLAQLVRTLAGVRAAIERALAGVTDSPAFVAGRFVGTAGFHGLDLAASLDTLTVALVHAAEVSTARMHRLLDSRFTGLTAQLAPRPGPDSGLVAVHKRAVGVVHDLRRNAVPSLLGSVETSFGQEDVQTFCWEAAANARTAFAGVTDVLACELLVAAHALRLRDVTLGPALESATRSVRAAVEPIERDRVLGPDIEALRALLDADGLGPSVRSPASGR